MYLQMENDFPPDTTESLRHKRDLLTTALCDFLKAQNIIRSDANPGGPELLMVVKTVTGLAA